MKRAPPAPVQRIKKSEETRERVLDAAVNVLAKRGFAQTSVQDIADAAGIAKGAVHYHFESKDDLVGEVLARCSQTIEQRVQAVFEGPGAPMDRVRRALVEMWIVRRDGVPQVRVWSELFTVSRHNPAIRRALGHQLRAARKQIVDVGLARLVEMGLRPKMSLDVTARLLLATLDGLTLHNTVDPVDAMAEEEMLHALEQMTLAVFDL